MAAVSPGEELFATHCASCHGLEAAGIGPRLGGITKVWSEKELLAFIQNPAKVIEAGNARAKAQFEKYKLVMPAFDYLKPEEIRSIITYIAQETNAKNIEPLTITATDPNTETVRYAPLIQPSKLRIELEDFVTIPASSDKLPRTRIATMRAHPSGDGTLYVSDQNGLIYRLDQGQAGTFLDVRPVIDNFVATPGLGTGLGSFAFHPDYLNNGLIYITYTEKPLRKPADYSYADSVKVALQWVVSEWKIKDVTSPVFEGTRRELLRINVPNVVHGTQDIGFVPGLKKGDPDYGMLYIGTGDGGSTISKHPELPHNLRSLLGTIIRIDPLGNNSPNGKYGIPSDNPFFNNPDPKVRKEIWAYGFRNPHRLAWWESPQGMKLLATEVGEGAVEEINLIEKGQDYGWNVREGDYAINYKTLDTVTPVPAGEVGTYRPPFAQYDHTDGNAISGGYVYEGPLEALKDKYIFSDIIRGRLWYLDLSQGLTDHTIHEFFVQQKGTPVTMKELSPTPRLDLRISYDPFKKEMYLMTKGDGKIRKIVKAYLEE
ncbi:PQQ-dependent sugar dehydrogenase [Salmonirosea aquatica]|uniref:PQQ-dependent sugar dehydrogenase n=1 Tax=Salmonirosea aquatica TaxID=2654236 RepID=UPI0035709B14